MKRFFNYLSVVGMVVLLVSMCCLLAPSLFYVASIGMLVGFIMYAIGLAFS